MGEITGIALVCPASGCVEPSILEAALTQEKPSIAEQPVKKGLL